MARSSHRLPGLPRLLSAAGIAGTTLGIAGRVLMRIIAREAGLPGSYSLGGSLEVVLFGVFIGTPVALVFWLSRPRLHWRRPLPGVALGLLGTGLLATFPPPSARSALAATPDTPVFTWLGFGFLVTAWAVALDRATPWIWRPRDAGQSSAARRASDAGPR